MSHLSDPIYRHQTSNWHFLLSETDSHDDDQADLPEIISITRLQEEFPDLLMQDDFLASAMKRLYAVEQFGAAVISVDSLSRLIDPNDVMIHITIALDELCQSEGGFWGLLAHDLLGCFFAGKQAADCQKYVQTLQQKISASRNETISAGIAVYPMLSYKKNIILENAKKALDHAAFFGANSCVVFDSVSLNISGDKLYQNGDLEGAIEEFKLALILDENNINVHNSLGVCYGIKNQLNEALAEFKIAMGLDPKEIMAVYNTGYAHLLKKEFNNALEYFLAAEQMDNSVFELAIQTGRVYAELNQPGNAKKYFETAVRLNPKSAPAFRLLGDCCAGQDLLLEATAAYKTALKLNPDDVAAQSALGYLYEMQGKNADIALMLCKQAVESVPGNGLYHHRLGRIYLNRKQFKEALVEFKKATDGGYDSTEYVEKILKLSN